MRRSLIRNSITSKAKVSASYSSGGDGVRGRVLGKGLRPLPRKKIYKGSVVRVNASYRPSIVDEFNSECTDSQLNAEHWFARIKKLYNRNRSFLCVSCLHKLFM